LVIFPIGTAPTATFEGPVAGAKRVGYQIVKAAEDALAKPVQ